MLGLDRVADLVERESGLAVAATSRGGTIQASVVNAGVLDGPITHDPIVAFVARGGARKLDNLRERPRLTLEFRSGWEWIAVEGEAVLAGPDDRLDGIDPGQVPRLLRDIYAAAAGGASDDWAELDAVMALDAIQLSLFARCACIPTAHPECREPVHLLHFARP